MTKQHWKQLAIILSVYIVLALGFYWIVADDWKLSPVSVDAVVPSQSVEVTANNTVVQTFTVPADLFTGFTFSPVVMDSAGTVHISINDAQNNMLWGKTFHGNELVSYTANTVPFDAPIANLKGQSLTMHFTSSTGGIAVNYGSTRSAGKFDVQVETVETLTAGGMELGGQLALSLSGNNLLNADRYILPIAAILGIVIAALYIYLCRCIQHKQNHIFLKAIHLYNSYNFLLKQLVSRDFKVKYKSSSLGFIWSFLNPILSMAVYYFVFSTLFKSNQEYFPVFLMTGIVIFSYFSESTNLGMISIVGNAGLITKVYIPKYIFPLSKVLSSVINFCISMIPLLGVALIVGLPLHRSILLFPLVLLFLVAFCFGISLILATMNTFFRDTQFLWSVLLTMWNFLTPVFYPETIIPEQFLPIYRLNPLYQFLTFLRSIVIDGVSPAPISYLWCTLAAVIPLLIGLYVFRKNQDQFVLHM